MNTGVTIQGADSVELALSSCVISGPYSCSICDSGDLTEAGRLGCRITCADSNYENMLKSCCKNKTNSEVCGYTESKPSGDTKLGYCSTISETDSCPAMGSCSAGYYNYNFPLKRKEAFETITSTGQKVTKYRCIYYGWGTK